MADEIPPPATVEANVNVSIEPPAAKVARATVDAIGDVIVNLFALSIIAVAWLKYGAIDKLEAAGAAGVVLGYWSVASLIDRFTKNRVSRSPITMLIGAVVGGGKGGAAAAAAAEVARRTLALLPLALMLGACASWAEAKPYVRTVNDVARELCELTMATEAERQGIGIRELCLVPYILDPFLQAPELAAAAGRQHVPSPAGAP